MSHMSHMVLIVFPRFLPHFFHGPHGFSMVSTAPRQPSDTRVTTFRARRLATSKGRPISSGSRAIMRLNLPTLGRPKRK